MPKDYHDITRGVSTSLRGWRHDQPALISGFNTLSDAALAEGALDQKTKELIALALGVAVYMGGGPSLMYAADALSAFEQFASAGQPTPSVSESKPIEARS